MKNTKKIIAGYSPNRNWWNLIGTTSTFGGTRQAKKIGTGWTNFAAAAMETKKGGFKKNGFLSSNFMKLCRNIHCSVAAFEGLKKFKMAAVAMVTKVQKMFNSLQTEDPFETWHKNRSSLKVVFFVF